MYVKEMHIEVDLALQKIASNRTRKLLPQEIDWLLNKSQNRFIRSRARPKMEPNGMKSGGFEVIQDDVDAIKALVRRGVVLPAFRYDDRTIHSPLPGDYAYLVQDESVIKRIPPGVTPTITYGTKYANAFPIFTSYAPAPPYFKSVQITLNGTVIYDINIDVEQRLQSWPGLSSSDEVWVIINPMIRAIQNAGYEAYWEYYDNYAYPRCLVIVTPGPATGGCTTDGTFTTLFSLPISVQYMDAPYPTQYQANRLTASNLISSLLEVAFYGTQPEFPISEIAGRSLYVYYAKNFIVSNTVISYIRKPRRISLILGVDCELSPEYHGMICDETVEYTKAMIGDPNWEVKLQDNIRRTNLDQ